MTIKGLLLFISIPGLSRPLLWNGSMSFPDSVPVLRPSLPRTEHLLPWLKQIDETRIYSNHGPLANLFRANLASCLGAPPDAIVLSSSGTAALTMALLALDLPRPSACAIPAWTFPACAHAVLAAGLEPVLLDVSQNGWTITPDSVLAAAHNRHKGAPPLRAAMPVRAFGQPLDPAAWEDLQDNHNIAVVIDSASGFDSLRITHIPQVVSLHATKCFGIGEGGFIVSLDLAFCRAAACCGNFGYLGVRNAERIAINGKLSEYHAAVGLAALEEWPERRSRQYSVARAMRRSLSTVDEISLLPGWGQDWITSTCLVSAKPAIIENLERDMARAHIETRRWWPCPLPEQPAFASFSAHDTPVAQHLARSTIGLPFSEDMDHETIQRIANTARVHIRQKQPTA